jgi:solute carrier family 25 S-adenosylmethionine transporter 26
VTVIGGIASQCQSPQRNSHRPLATPNPHSVCDRANPDSVFISHNLFTMSPSQTSSPFTSALLAGGLAGTTVDLTLFPLDTLKTRLQSSSGFLASGGFTGIYRGVGSAIIGSAPGAALFFVTYESTKTLLQNRRHAGDILAGRDGSKAAPLEHMIAASAGEVAACAVRVPTEVVKQRAQAGQHSSSLLALRHILSQRGTIGLRGVWMEMYRGWSVTVMREVPFTIIQFPLWEGMKEWRRKSSGVEKVGALESGLFGSMAGAVAAGITTPLDVLKTRMMLATEKTAMVPLLKDILRTSGPRAFFAGIGPRVMWISIGGAIFLGSYQWAYNALEGDRS